MSARNVVVVGAGRTGRGMFGELFFSEGGFHLTFADCDRLLVEKLRMRGSYTVEQRDLVSGESSVTCVTGFDAVDTVRERQSYLDALAKAELVAVAVFPSSFDAVADDLAGMVALRQERGSAEKVAIILGGNFVGLKDYFSRALEERLDAEGRAYLGERAALITSKANRKVSFADGCGEDPLPLSGDNKPVLPVDDAFPFGPGYEYPSFFELGADVEASMVEKIWSENLMHCSLGFMGVYRGLDTVNEAAADGTVRTLAYLAWCEGRRALEAEYGMEGPSPERADEMLGKFGSPFFQDKIERVVRQPMRKLGRNERFVGPALLCLNHGITPYFIARAAAHGFCPRKGAGDEFSGLLRMEHDLGLEAAVVMTCGLDEGCADERLLRDLIVGAARDLLTRDGRLSVGGML